MEKTLSYIAIVLAIIALIVSFGCNKSAPLGGYTAGYWDSAEGYKVDGTTIIDGSGNIDSGGVIAGTSITVTGAGSIGTTLTVTGETNADTVIIGGDVTTIASSATTSVTAAQFCNSTVIRWAPLADASSDLTLPSTSTLFADCLTADGDSKTVLFMNISATAASTTQIVKGDGLDLLEPDGQNVEIAGLASALLYIVRTTSTEASVVVDELIVAD